MKIGIAIILSSLALTPALHAHEGHTHEAAMEAAPHGGLLRDAAPFKAEAVLNGDVVRIYVYDKMLKPVVLDKDQAKAEVQFPKQKSKPVIFKRKEGAYEATIKGISKVHRYDLHVNLEINGQKALADFGIDNIQ
jgi:hypothetical protein